MKTILFLIISAALAISGYSQTRNVLIGTNNAVVQPTNFWSADSSNARSGLGLGSAATNPTTAFQPSSLVLTNLSTNNGSSLTNIVSSNIVGTLSLGQGGTGATNASGARTALGLGTAATNPASTFQASSLALSNLAASNGGALTNLSAASIVGQIPTNNLPAVNFTNISGTLSIANGGTSATNAANARQNLGSTTVGDAVFVATNTAAARAAIGALSTNGSALGLTNFPTVPLASNVTGTIAISNGGSGATTAGGARTNLGLGATNDVQFNAVNTRRIFDGTNAIIDVENNFLNHAGFGVTFEWQDTANTTYVPFAFGGDERALNAATTRTNLGLGWSGLTNTNAATFQTALFGSNTNPVLVNTNGSVVSPTNFWQMAPIVTRFVETQPTVNQTTNIVAARNLHIHSLTISVVGVTNTIALPTTNSFNGDVALVVHQGPTSSVTAVRTAGAATNLITLNQFEQTVEFIYYDNVWQLNHNQSFIEPVFFSGTNASANAAASVNNLFAPNVPLVFNTNGQVVANTGTNVLTLVSTTNQPFSPVKFRNWDSGNEMQIVLTDEGLAAGYSAVRGSIGSGGGDFQIKYGDNSNEWGYPLIFASIGDGVWQTVSPASTTNDSYRFNRPISFNNNTNAATTRTNLGIPLAALTNTTNANFQAAVFTTNTTPTNAANLGNAVAWMEINVITNGSNSTFRIPLFK